MKLTLSIKMDNAAFVNHEACETVRILRQLADKMDEGIHIDDGDEFPLRDANGKTVGLAKISGRRN